MLINKFNFSIILISFLSTNFCKAIQQEEFNKVCVETAIATYSNINANVTFSECLSTKANNWENYEIMSKIFFVKKKDIFLSDAIKELISISSETSFECTTAQTIYIWQALLAKEDNLNKLISDLEKNDQSFFIPIIMPNILSSLEDYANYYRFSERTGNFMIGNLTIDTPTEYQKLKAFRKNLNKLKIFTNCFEPVYGENLYLQQCHSIPGGTIYLPNVDGVKGAAKGENLICIDIDANSSRYYGFGLCFKNGPTTLSVIACSLEAAARQQNLYDHKIAELKKNKLIPQVSGEIHPLEYLVNSDTCFFISIKNIEYNLSLMQEELAQAQQCYNCKTIPLKLFKCSICRAVSYCGKDCQTQNWPHHKKNCKKI